jgi:hypothetical protein
LKWLRRICLKIVLAVSPPDTDPPHAASVEHAPQAATLPRPGQTRNEVPQLDQSCHPDPLYGQLIAGHFGCVAR